MGRWAQAGRRGTVEPGAGFLARPPAPVLSFPGPFYLSTQTGLDDFGGFLDLFFSATGLDPWVVGDGGVWFRSRNWGELVWLKGKWVAVSETGNGEVYAGTSPRSNALFVPL